MEVSLTEMLEAREKRAWRQRELLKRGRTVICFTMNIAGPIKNSPLVGSGYDLGKRLLLGQLDVAGVAVSDFEEVREKTGNECILLVDAEPLAVKAITAELEDHAPIGRLFGRSGAGSAFLMDRLIFPSGVTASTRTFTLSPSFKNSLTSLT